ncbi:VOC family protein [Nakamurella sp.]|uniref:VOC family protein n=1 Tax=Nakamurella sp. TaxID=1869182 RepID=UPI003B3B47C2
MATTLNPYLNWRSSAREAMEFYHSVFGGELTASTFKEFGMPVGPGEEELVMHSQLVTPDLTLMGADTPSQMPLAENPNGSVSLSGGPEDEAQLRAFWDGLSAGGTVTVPLEKAPWGDYFGMLVDRFGVNWLVNIAGGGS